ncbi:MAG: carboxypeptidase-like regulatory domain-containing protein [Caulobacteraceae bacterium]|nr:carboxypeptidase-like regulatory domain-containing protein [Caulobacteraceae bacterium]
MKKAGLSALLAMALAGCATAVAPVRPSLAPPPPPPPPPPMEVGAVFGSGTYRTPNGGHGSCAGFSVALMSETAHSKARMLALYGSAERAVAPVSQVKIRSAKLAPSNDSAITRSAQCAADGHFAISDLPAGSYFLIARVRVTRPAGAPQDLVVMRHVDLRLGETREVRLAD